MKDVDIIDVIESIFMIKNVDGVLVHFDLYDFQKFIISDMVDNKYIDLYTARQVGGTKLAIAYLLAIAMMTKSSMMVVGRNIRTSIRLLRIIREELLSKTNLIDFDNSDNEHITLVDGVLIASPQYYDTNQLSYDMALIDEYKSCHLDNLLSDKISKASIVIATNPQKPKKYIENCHNFKTITIPWYVIRERDLQWKHEMKKHHISNEFWNEEFVK